jgi:hypothetical protein
MEAVFMAILNRHLGELVFRYFENTMMTELYFGFAYIAAGEQCSPARREIENSARPTISLLHFLTVPLTFFSIGSVFGLI